MRAAWFLSLASVICVSCGTLPDGRRWGQNATFLPPLERVGTAAVDALKHPATWIPASLGLVLAIGDLDEDLERWASDETPIFGSRDAADDWSGHLRQALVGMSVLSTIATPGGDEPLPWIDAKARAFILRDITSYLRKEATDQTKDAASRRRPDRSDDFSFLSGHTSGAFNYQAWFDMNLEAIGLPKPVARGLDGLALGMAIGTGWARIEAHEHFPTDVLAGAALGNFVARFMQGAFLGEPRPGEPRAFVDTLGDNVMLGVSWSF